MFRRDILRATGGTITTGLAVGLAGCSGDGDSNTDTSDEQEDGENTDDGQSDTENSDDQDQESDDGEADMDDSEDDQSETDGSDGDSDGMDDSDGSDDTEDSQADGSDSDDGTQDSDIPGSVGTNEIDGLEIAGFDASIESGSFSVEVTLENVGEETTESSGYSFNLRLYDDADAQLNENEEATATVPPFQNEIPPGEQRYVSLSSNEEVNAEEIARFEVDLYCGDFNDGVYCE